MLTKALVVLAVSALVGSTAQATGINGATVSRDKHTTTAQPGTTRYAPAIKPPRRLDTIFDNIGFKYPEGLYFCCYGNTISGPSSQIGQTVWPASQFTPEGDATIKTIDVALGWVSGANRVVINIAKDDGGIPGKVLGSFAVTGLGVFGDCCQLAEVTGNVKIKVKGGAPYWIFISTDDQSKNTWAAWPFNSTDQVNTINNAAFDGTSWTAFGPGRPAVSFALFGHAH